MELIEELFDSITQENLQYAREIITSGCDINFQLEDGVTPLMMAASTGNLGIVQLLVETGADINQIDVYGNSALMYASFENFWDIVDYLIPLAKPELRATHLFAAASEGHTRLVQAIISSGINVDAYRQKGVWNQNGMTALMISAQAGYSKIVKVLLDANANPNLTEGDTGGTPLMYGVESGNVEVVRLLLKAEADLNSQNFTGKTALIKAVKMGNTEMVKTLLQANADITIKDHDGKIALNYALESNHIEIAKLLQNAKGE
ncbi:ankyrin repeat domain-containing protein [Nostoc sp. FACHB-190]|uniref:ankyrin repeat domain-containing protein n=1 Tax=Nostoc sp. FACHB-190 TaxID=2692838 RepID=UPI0016841E9B|nr:ankyrin repeat domain-containing protein [Nostoc sp. FACHB-190]MBD2302556.1 ankyrin repeat domain-containing protein [Nostoc sp. FACHB-190]